MERGKRQAWSSFFGSTGFYIALLLCVVVAGIAGLFALLNRDGEEETTPPAVEANQPDTAVTAPPVEVSGVEEEIPAQGEPDPAPAVTVTMPETQEETETAAPEEPVAVVSPLAGETVTVFSVEELQYNATTDDWRIHDGVDIAASAGTPVVAASAGTVVAVERDGSMGTTVVIGHAGGYETTYASLQEELQVEVGDTVSAGEQIGTVGNTSLSESALGAHLHFSVRQEGEAVDPAEFLGS